MSTESYEEKYAKEIQEAVRSGRAQLAPDGTIVLDPTSKVCPLELARYNDKQQYIQGVIAAFSEQAEAAGAETFEESNDFGPPDDEWDDVQSPHEVPEPRSMQGWHEDLEMSATLAQRASYAPLQADPSGGAAPEGADSESQVPPAVDGSSEPSSDPQHSQ